MKIENLLALTALAFYTGTRTKRKKKHGNNWSAVRVVAFENPHTACESVGSGQAVFPIRRSTRLLARTPINYSCYYTCVPVAIDRCVRRGVSTMRFDSYRTVGFRHGAGRTRFGRETTPGKRTVTFKTVLERNACVHREIFLHPKRVLYCIFYIVCEKFDFTFSWNSPWSSETNYVFSRSRWISPVFVVESKSKVSPLASSLTRVNYNTRVCIPYDMKCKWSLQPR